MRKFIFLVTLLILILGCVRPFEEIGRPIYKPAQKQEEAYFIVSVQKANLRVGPGTRFEAIDQAGEGDRYLILEAVEPYGDSHSWYRIKIDDLREAWISGSVGYIEGQARKLDNVVNASIDATWPAILESLEWMKWKPAFVEKDKNTIRLKEAYVYRKSGKLFRIYHWPPVRDAERSSIDDYLEKIAYYEKDFFDPVRTVISQENMKIRLIDLSESQTEIIIDYEIKPYLESGKFRQQIKSNGYMESLLLDKTRDNLSGVSLRQKTGRNTVRN